VKWYWVLVLVVVGWLAAGLAVAPFIGAAMRDEGSDDES
jgi:hypothetical protein